MFAVVGREMTIVLVIALLTAAGSQLPRLVRALGQPAAVKPPIGGAEPQTVASQASASADEL
jgi:hypothetical protein